MIEVAQGAVRAYKASPKPDLYVKEMGPRTFLEEEIPVRSWMEGIAGRLSKTWQGYVRKGTPYVEEHSVLWSIWELLGTDDLNQVGES